MSQAPFNHPLVKGGLGGFVANTQNTKIRPNDKVNVRYTDGKIVMDVKYKKVEDDIKNGNAVII